MSSADHQVSLTGDGYDHGGWVPQVPWYTHYLVLTPSGSHQNIYGWQAGSMNPAEMPSCYCLQMKFVKAMFLHVSVILSTEG